MAETSTQSITIGAPRARIAEVICDFPRYPEWVSAARQVEVVQEYEDGYASQVRFVLDAAGLRDEYILAYVLMSSQGKQTITVWLAGFTTQRGTEWGPLMAASTLIALPVVAFFLLVQRRMASGLTAGAVKG